MSFQVIITGKLTQNPQRKTSKNGNPYVWMLLSVPTEQERTSASVLGFDSGVIDVMGKLSNGDEIAVTGTANINQWEKDDGTVRVSLNVIASQVMTMYQHRKKKTRFKEEDKKTSSSGVDDFEDDIGSL